MNNGHSITISLGFEVDRDAVSNGWWLECIQLSSVGNKHLVPRHEFIHKKYRCLRSWISAENRRIRSFRRSSIPNGIALRAVPTVPAVFTDKFYSRERGQRFLDDWQLLRSEWWRRRRRWRLMINPGYKKTPPKRGSKSNKICRFQ